MSNLKLQGNASGTGTLTLQSANTSSSVTLTLPATDGTNGQFLTTDGSGNLSFATSGSGTVTSVSWTGGIVSVANPTSTPAFTIAGTSGGIPYFSSTSAWASSGLLSANQFVIGGGAGAAPTSTTTISWTNTFTAAQTFRAASAVRSEAAATQDAVVLAGRAGGTSSYAVSLTPTTLSSSRTVTLPDADTTVPVANQTLTYTGPTAARTITLPDENFSVGFRNIPQSGVDKTTSYTLATSDIGKFVGVGTSGSITIPNNTFAAGDVISLFNNTTGNITITASITTCYIAGVNTDKDTLTFATRGVATILFISGTVCVISGNVS